MEVSRIKWITDGEEVNLPSEVEVDDSLSDDEIADYLFSRYGFPVEGFLVPLKEGEWDEFGLYVNGVEAMVS